MNNLLSHLAGLLKSELSRILASQARGEVRLILRGLPLRMMEGLLVELGGDAGLQLIVAGGGVRRVPVYLVTAGVTNPSGLSSGKCTDSHLVIVRNNRECPCFITLLPPGVSINQSISSSAIYLGVDPASDRGEIRDDPFVRQLVMHAVQQFSGAQSRRQSIQSVVDEALADAARFDIGTGGVRVQWEVIERLFEVAHSAVATEDRLLAALGFPPCELADLGSKQHLTVLARVGQELETLGVSVAFGGWVDSAADLRASLLAAENFLRAKGADGATFARSPSECYRLPMSAVLSDELPAWWRELSLARWNDLLNADSQLDLELRVVSEGSVINASAGLPTLFQDRAAFKISVGTDDADGVLVKVSMSRGNRDYTSVGEVPLVGREGRFVLANIPEHKSPLRIRFEADGFRAVAIRVIVLDHYSPGIVLHSRGALKQSLFRASRPGASEYECDLELPGVGSHHVDILHGKHVQIGASMFGYDTSSESSEPLERPINHSGASSAAALIDTDDESTHEFSADMNDESARFKIYVRAADAPPTGASSVFDRLVLEHRSVVGRVAAASRVERVACRVDDLQRWLLESPESFRPLVLGEDYLKAWAAPQWQHQPILSSFSLQHDPRPDATSFRPPSEFLRAREDLRVALRSSSSSDDLVEHASLGERMRDDRFCNAVFAYLREYLQWLKHDYESAVWSDLMCAHRIDSGAGTLCSYPYAVLLTPLHPLRFGWQCVAQALLQSAIDRRTRCPAASILDPRNTPDCLILPCRTPIGTIAQRSFLSVASSSDYWGVLWSGEPDQLRALEVDSGRMMFDSTFGITIDGLASGFSVAQVERVIDEVAHIWSAKSTLRVRVASDTRGASSTNEGIASWARKSLGENDPWRRGGGRVVEVYDERPEELQPEDAELSTLTQVLDASVRWFGSGSARPHADLSIIAHLGTQSPELHRHHGLESAIDAVGLSRTRVRRQLASTDGKYIAESRIGRHAASPEIIEGIPSEARSVSGQFAQIVQFVEGKCSAVFDSYVFMPRLATLERAIAASQYCAVSSTHIDPACFFGVAGSSFLWDYDLPSYSRRAGENNGFYLIASASETIFAAARSAINSLGAGIDVDDSAVGGLLREISKRGMPTLKRLTGGGTASLGEIGMLACLRALQCEFSNVSWDCVFPVRPPGAPVVNLLVPVDPFRAYVDELRQGLQLQEYERPDLLAISLRFEGDQLVGLKLTPIEVKARTGVMSDSQLSGAIAQAGSFSRFLEQLTSRGTEHAIWGIAHRHLVATWIDYAFRVYGQIRHLMEGSEWHRWHSEVIGAVLAGRVVPEIDPRGRLFVVCAAQESEKRDLDNDDLHEALIVSRSDALSILLDPATKVPARLKSAIGDWRLEVTSQAQGASSESPRAGASSSAAPPLNPLCVPPVDQIAVSAEQPPLPRDDFRPAGNSHVADSQGDGIKFPVGYSVSTIEPQQQYLHPSNTALNQLNIGIVGDLGVGKTQLIQSLIYQFRRDANANRGKSPSFFILDYKKDYSKKEFVDAIGARVVRPKRIPLNLFDKRQAPDPSTAWLHRARCFIDILSRVYSNIGPVQQERIKKAVKDAYALAAHRPNSEPTLDEVFHSYSSIVGDRFDAPYSIMSNMVDMELFERDPDAVLPATDFFSGPVVMDLGFLQDDDKTKNVVVAIMLNLFFSYMISREKRPFIGSDPQLRFIDSFLLVDEANNIMQYEFDVLKKLLLQGREFGVGVMLASQYLSHFKTANEDYREPLLTWFVHKVPNLGVRDLVGIGLTDVDQSLVDRIKVLQNHHCLYKTFNVSGKVIRATPFFELHRER